MCFWAGKCTKNVQALKFLFFAIASDLMFDMHWGVPLIFLNDAFMISSYNMFQQVRELILPAVISSEIY